MPRPVIKREWVLVLIVVLAVLPIILGLAFQYHIHAAYLHRFVGPELEQEFGFKGGTEILHDGKQAYDVFVVLTVVPSGTLGRAGLHPGDIPVGYKHGFEAGFYQDLLWAKKGERIDLQVVNISDARRNDWKRRNITLQLKSSIR